MSVVTRRRLLAAASAAIALCWPAARWAAGAPSPSEDGFSFVVFGDTHFDRLEHHDFAWMEQNYQKDIVQVQDYSRKTAETLPALFQAVLQRAERTSPPVKLAVHLGDAVEGLCGSPDLARRQSREFFEFYQQQGFQLPLLPTKGNHDITGPGAKEAYQEIFLGQAQRSLGREISAASYAVEMGDWLLAFYDAYDPRALDWLQALLDGGRSARRLFLFVHPPVTPYTARSSWRVMPAAQHAEKRAQLIELLGRHRAIVFSGHLHKYSFLVRRTSQGRFAQVGLCSVLDQPDQPVRDWLEGVDNFGPQRVDDEPDFDPSSRQARQEILQQEQPYIERFEYAQTAGFAVVRVEGGQASADIYTGIGRQCWRTLDLHLP